LLAAIDALRRDGLLFPLSRWRERAGVRVAREVASRFGCATLNRLSFAAPTSPASGRGEFVLVRSSLIAKITKRAVSVRARFSQIE